MEYLKDKSYYEELYDKITIRKCRRTEQISVEQSDKDIEAGVKAPKGSSLAGIHKMATELYLYFETGDRYLSKEKTIGEWMDLDRQRDQIYQKPEPLLYCPKCNNKMPLLFKHLDERLNSEKIRVLYLYRCDGCNEKRGIYDDGENYIFKSEKCPKCGASLASSTKEMKNKTVIKNNCTKCNYTATHSYDLDEPEIEKVDPEYEKDRIRFCLSKEEGEKYRTRRSNLEYLANYQKDKEEHKEAFEKASETKILNIAQLSDLMNKKIIKENYGSLAISNPEVGRDLIVNFNVQDTKADRSEACSKRDFKKILSDLLVDTNWHLMSEGLNYKLGIISGRLRGQDSQERIYEDLKDI